MIWITLCAVMGITSDSFLQKYLNLPKRPATILFSLLSSFLLITAFDYPLQIAKGCLFFQLLILAGYIDHKTREIPNVLVLLVALCGFIDLQLLSSLEGAAMIFLLMMADYLISGAIGGGDVKLMTACGFVLGVFGAWQAGFLSMVISFVYTLLCKHRSLKEKSPLAPFIGIGCAIAYILPN